MTVTKKSSPKEVLREIAFQLLAANQCQRLYPAQHPRRRVAIRDLFLRLRGMLNESRQIRVAYTGDEFVVDNLQVPVEGELFDEFGRILDRSRISKLVLSRGLRQWEVQAFMEMLSREPSEIDEAGGFEVLLTSAGIDHIFAGKIRIDSREVLDAEYVMRAWESYSQGLSLIRDIKDSANGGDSPLDVEGTREWVGGLVDVATNENETLLALHALKSHDEYSFTHSVNVAMLSLSIAHAMGFDDYQLHEITLAALLHDIGKERVSDDVLRKPGKLDDDEWVEMQRHSSEGMKMIVESPSATELCAIVAYEHQLAYEPNSPDHGKWPLHLVSQIVCVADVYDALRSIRPYRDAIPADRAMKIMREEAEKKFDADIFEGFEKRIGYYPPGTCVKLANGMLAVAYRSNPDAPRLPMVVIVRDAEGNQLIAPLRIDLADPIVRKSDPGYEIEAIVDGDEVGLDAFDYL